MAKKTEGKTVSSKGASFVLMIGDEGAILVQMQRKRVTRRLFAQSPETNHIRAIEEALLAAPNAPITILVDMMDQSYVHQTLPPVSSLSVGKIVKRRMDKDFAPSDIKGYVMLGREKTGRKDWNYMMVSLAASPLLQKWIAFVVERNNPFKGIGLIPLEAQPFVLAIQSALHKGDKTFKPMEWQILVCHHKVGGFRQIVLHNGKLAFTRMAQPIAESVPEVIAGHIEQEMINTLEYLKRMGLQDTSTLCAVIVTSEEIKSSLDAAKLQVGESHFYTPFELAELLSIPDAAQPEDHFGDVVLSSFIIKRNKLLLRMQTPYTQKLQTLAMAAVGLKAVGVLGALAIVGWAGYTAYDIYSLQDEIQTLKSQQVKLQSDLDAIKLKAKSLPKEIDTITDVVGLVKMYDKRRFDAMSFLSTFAGTLHDTALVNSYQWSITEPLTVTPDADKRQISAEIEAHLIQPHEPKKDYIASAQDFIKRIKKDLPDFDVTTGELPGVAHENEAIKTVISDKPDAAAKTESVVDTVKITIKGPITPKAGS